MATTIHALQGLGASRAAPTHITRDSTPQKLGKKSSIHETGCRSYRVNNSPNTHLDRDQLAGFPGARQADRAESAYRTNQLSVSPAINHNRSSTASPLASGRRKRSCHTANLASGAPAHLGLRSCRCGSAALGCRPKIDGRPPAAPAPTPAPSLSGPSQPIAARAGC